MSDKDKKVEEDKVLYKGEEMSPKEFAQRFEVENKKKERNAESVARQKLEEKQEEESRRKAFVNGIIPQEEDKVADDYGPGSDQQEAQPDMSMYQVNLPFDVQEGPNLSLGPIGQQQIPQPEIDYRLGGLMSLIDDNNIQSYKIQSYKPGGKRTSKGKDGTVTNKFRDKEGNSVTQVKTKDGKYFEKKSSAQDAFDKDFKVTGKSNYDKVSDKVDQDKQAYLKQVKESKFKLPEDVIKKDLEDIEKGGWKKYGKVGEQRPEATVKSFTPDKPQGFMDKAVDIVSNPMTSAGFLMRGQAIPDHMQRDMDKGTFGYFSNGSYHTERNPLDLAIGDMTGLSLANDIRDVKKGAENKDIAQAGWGLFGAIPGASELKGAIKGTKNIAKHSDEVMDAYNLAVDLKNKGLIKELPDSPDGFGDWLKGKYNQKPLYRVVDVNPKVTNDPAFRSQMKNLGKNPDNPYEVAEYMGTTPAPSNVVNRGRRSGGHDQLIEGTNKDILYFAEDPTWIGKRYGGENPYYVKTFADPLPENMLDQVKRLRSNSQAQKNYSRNYPGFDMNNVPHGVLFEDKLLSVGPNSITPIVGDKGKSVRKVHHIVSGSDFERLPNKRFELGGLMDLINDDNISAYKESKKSKSNK